MQGEGTTKPAGDPGPRIWCAGCCGTWVNNIGEPGPAGAVLVLLGDEPFWFCGVACASNFLEHMYLAIYEPRRLPPRAADLSCLMSFHTISEN